MADDVRDYIQRLSAFEDAEIDLGLAALSIAARNHPERSTDRYLNHIEQLKQKTGERFVELVDAGAKDTAQTRLAALKHVLHDEYDYRGDQKCYESIDGADLIETIDGRCGLPVTLAILYIICARSQGWVAGGINFPAHFLPRLEYDGERVIFDPFQDCRMMQAADLRQLLKQHMGEEAELSNEYYQPISNRAVLIRLQNNIKLRLIQAGDYQKALDTVEIMMVIDPGEFRLLLDAGVLYARTGKTERAIQMLESYITHTPSGRDKEEAALMIRHLREML